MGDFADVCWFNLIIFLICPAPLPRKGLGEKKKKISGDVSVVIVEGLSLSPALTCCSHLFVNAISNDWRNRERKKRISSYKAERMAKVKRKMRGK